MVPIVIGGAGVLQARLGPKSRFAAPLGRTCRPRLQLDVAQGRLSAPRLSVFHAEHGIAGFGGVLTRRGPLRAASIAACTMLNARTPRAAAAINNDVEAIAGVEEVVSGHRPAPASGKPSRPRHEGSKTDLCAMRFSANVAPDLPVDTSARLIDKSWSRYPGARLGGSIRNRHHRHQRESESRCRRHRQARAARLRERRVQ